MMAANPAAWSQTFITQYSFTNTPDGANPLRLTLANGLLFGSTANGGTNGSGTLFTFNTNNFALTTIYNFTTNIGSGSSPDDVVVSGNEIYGITQVGGTNNVGMIYSVGTNGTGFTSLYSFDGYPDGEYPRTGLILNDGVLYGTTYTGGTGIGTNGGGTVFKINTDGSGYATLHSFTNNPDGAQPQGELVISGNTLYGTTTYGGTNNRGTIFAINTDGTGYTILHSFDSVPEPQYPYGGLVLSGGILYGTGSFGGANTNNGGIFAINTDGTGFRVLYSFSGFTGNMDGTTPKATLTLGGSYLYGTTVSGGSGNGGTIFLINTNGTGFTVLGSFTNGAASGSDLLGGVIRVGNAIWGTTYQSAISNAGTLFLLPLPAITSQPQSLSVTNGNPAVFSVSAADDSTINYQWYFNTNTLLAGQTNNILTFASTTTNNAGTYTVAASDSLGSVTSAPAVLTVIVPASAPTILSFTLDPASGSASFEVANVAGSTNRLWASTNLASPDFWQVIATNVMDVSGLWFFTDTNTAKTNDARFYRFSTP